MVLLALSLLASGVLYAQPRTLEQAQTVAAGILPSPRIRGAQLTLLTEKQLPNSEPAYYVFTTSPATGRGFAIVSGQQALPEIIGYSTDSRFVLDSLPEGLKAYLRYVEWAASQPAQAHRQGQPLLHPAVAPIAPLLKDLKWDQGKPYDSLLPKLPKGGQPPVGCVATALAQLCRYYCWPPEAIGKGGYYMEGSTSDAPTSYSFSKGDHKYDYTLLSPTYDASCTDAQRYEVAKLCRDLGAAVKMSYTQRESGAYDFDALTGMVSNFLYHADLRLCLRAYYTDEEWEELVVSELQAGRPVYYSGTAGQGGHAFVCDGYDGAGKYHFNWGWSGYGNGYYLLSDLSPTYQGIGAGQDGGYVVAQGIMQGMQPGYKTPLAGLPVPWVADQLLLADGTKLLNEGQTPVTKKTKLELNNVKVSGIMNYGAGKQSCQVAMRLTELDGTLVNTFKSTTLKLASGFYQLDDHSNFNVSLSDVPDGDYLLFPVIKRVRGDWEKLRLHKHAAQAIKVTVKGNDCELAYHTAPVVELKGEVLTSMVHQNTFSQLQVKITNVGTAPYAANVGFALLETATDTINKDYVYFTSTYLMTGQETTFSEVVAPGLVTDRPYIVPVWDASAGFGHDKVWEGVPHSMLRTPTPLSVSSTPIDSALWPIAEFSDPQLDKTQDDKIEIRLRLKNQSPNTYFEGLFSLGYFTTPVQTGQTSYNASDNLYKAVEGSDYVDLTFVQHASALHLGTSVVHAYIMTPKGWRRLNDGTGNSATMEINIAPGTPPIAEASLPVVRHDVPEDFLKNAKKGLASTAVDAAKYALRLTPNPASTQVTISLDSHQPILRVELYALTGQLLYSRQQETLDCTLDLSSLQPGAYLVRVQDGEGLYTTALLQVQR